MRQRPVVVVLGITALLAVVSPMSSASAASVSCGDRITSNVVLTHNLKCVGSGIILDAPGLTVDLRGYTLSGSGVGYGLVAGVDAVVKNGIIRNFDNGVAGFTSSRLIGLKFVGNNNGLDDVHGSQVSGSTFTNNTVGIAGGSATVTESTFVSNGIAIESAGAGTASATVASSTFRGNTTAVTCSDANATVTDSRFVDNATSIDAIRLCGLSVHDSTFKGGVVAVHLAMQVIYPLDVQRNTFSGADIGMQITGIFGGDGYVIADNAFSDNAASGLALDVQDAHLSDVVLVSGNSFKRNGFWPGDYVDSSGRTLDAGLFASSGNLTGNRAVNNGGYGIEGYGVLDGGANTAKSNGNPSQCLGVTCTR